MEREESLNFMAKTSNRLNFVFFLLKKFHSLWLYYNFLSNFFRLSIIHCK